MQIQQHQSLSQSSFQPTQTNPENPPVQEKANNIARAFARAGGFLGGLCCLGKATTQVDSPPGTPRQVPPNQPIFEPGLQEIQPEDIPARPSASLPSPAPSASEVLRQSLFHEGSLSVAAQLQIRNEILERSAALGESPQNPFFSFRHIQLPGFNTEVDGNRVFVTSPNHMAKLVLANLYEKKYGIQILVQKHALNEKQLMVLLMEKLAESNGQPLGLVLQPQKLDSLLRKAKHSLDKDSVVPALQEIRPPATKDYEDHVAPVIVQSSSLGFDVINLDFLEDRNFTMISALQGLRSAGVGIRRMELHVPQRQADLYSCHTDAMQVLKDALQTHQQTGGNLYQHYWNQHGIKTFNPTPGDFIDAYPIDLPPQLYKGVQRSKAMEPVTRSIQDAMSTTAPSSNPNKQQTIAQHRNRFSVSVAEKSKAMNHFLVFKAYRNALKVLDKLESFSGTQAREAYLETIKTRHEFK